MLEADSGPRNMLLSSDKKGLGSADIYRNSLPMPPSSDLPSPYMVPQSLLGIRSASVGAVSSGQVILSNVYPKQCCWRGDLSSQTPQPRAEAEATAIAVISKVLGQASFE